MLGSARALRAMGRGAWGLVMGTWHDCRRGRHSSGGQCLGEVPPRKHKGIKLRARPDLGVPELQPLKEKGRGR